MMIKTLFVVLVLLGAVLADNSKYRHECWPACGENAECTPDIEQCDDIVECGAFVCVATDIDNDESIPIAEEINGLVIGSGDGDGEVANPTTTSQEPATTREKKSGRTAFLVIFFLSLTAGLGFLFVRRWKRRQSAAKGMMNDSIYLDAFEKEGETPAVDYGNEATGTVAIGIEETEEEMIADSLYRP